MEYRIVKISRSFWVIERPKLSNPVWPISTKRAMYKAIMLAVLIFGAKYVRQLTTLHIHWLVPSLTSQDTSNENRG